VERLHVLAESTWSEPSKGVCGGRRERRDREGKQGRRERGWELKNAPYGEMTVAMQRVSG